MRQTFSRNSQAGRQHAFPSAKPQGIAAAALQGSSTHRKALDIGRRTRAARETIQWELAGIMLGKASAKSRFMKVAALGCVVLALGACSSIRESRGYVVDGVLLQSVQPGIDNRRSVEGTLGRPTFQSQYGEDTWYYISSTTGRRPFVRPRIQNHAVLAVQFDASGNVKSVERRGVEEVVFLQPEGDKTPTLGRERTFLEDLFGNIGQVGAGGGPGGPGGP